MNRNYPPQLWLLLMIVMLYLSGCSTPVNSTAGSNLLPVPQQMNFSGKSFFIDSSWTISAGENISPDDPAFQSLASALNDSEGIKPYSGNHMRRHAIHLDIMKGAVSIKSNGEILNEALEDQAYRLTISSSEISIVANAPAGLYYGVQTLIQLMNKENGKIFVPAGEINDWPDLEVRMIYWDCAHHLEKMETFKRAIKQASYFKINALALKLEGHFLYSSAKAVVEPYALSPAEYQELTDYALAHYVQLVPYLDAPGHVAFILKHPEYASLRTNPDVNYELSIINPGTYRLINDMFGELIAANRGGKYILFSTDEAYYAGKADDVREAVEAGGKGKLLAQFISKVADSLHAKGRTVISWIEYPLDSSDISELPSHLINGVYSSGWAPYFKKNGMRQFIYTSGQGEEPLFPNYYLPHGKAGRVEEITEAIRSATAPGTSGLEGVIVAAWGDAGLHPETFWLGYVAGTSAAWNITNMNPDDLSERFFNSFYGSENRNIGRVYELLSTQAQFWNSSWFKGPSDLRSPILGNSDGFFEKPQPANDYKLPVLPVISAENLSVNKNWSSENKDLIALAKEYMKENNELTELLDRNIEIAEERKHNLLVYKSIALLCRQNLDMILGLHAIDTMLLKSGESASTDLVSAIALVDQALARADSIRNYRNEVFNSLASLWYHDWQPLVAEANGRKFLFAVDDIKDHLPGRTIDLSYLIYRQIHYPLDDWSEQVRNARNEFARHHGIEQATKKLGNYID